MAAAATIEPSSTEKLILVCTQLAVCDGYALNDWMLAVKFAGTTMTALSIPC
jgi:hypothetical protein